MFFEYALEPAVISTWQSARYFLDAFGADKGRFLAQYPKDWRRHLENALRQCGDHERKSIVHRLELAKKHGAFFRRRGISYDEAKTWLENAITEHAREPFRAIIAHEQAEAENEAILHAATLDTQNALWRVDQGRLLSREPAVVVRAVNLLLRSSSSIHVIDPYFRADQPDKTQFLTVLCNHVKDHIEEVHVHVGDTLGHAFCMHHAERALPNAIPPGMKITLHCWRERSGGERLHNRYVVTNIGGVQFGDGIETGDPGQHDRLSILEESTRAQLWDHYWGPTPAFDRTGPEQTFEGRRGKR